MRKFPEHGTGKGSPGRGHRIPRVEGKELSTERPKQLESQNTGPKRRKLHKRELQRLAEGPLHVFIRVLVSVCR